MPPFMPTRSPAAGRVTILVLSHLRWDSGCQRPKQVMTRLGRYCDVLFVEGPFDDGVGAVLRCGQWRLASRS